MLRKLITNNQIKMNTQFNNSRVNANANANANQDKSKKSYCKVCADSKKSMEEVTSHNVRSPEGIVLCPTLLSQSCRYCKQNGHTVKFCKSLEEKNKIENKIQSQLNYEKSQQAKIVVTKNQGNSKKYISNGFAALCADTDTDNESDTEELLLQEQKREQQEYPSLPGSNHRELSSQQLSAISYASALQAVKPIHVNVPVPKKIPLISNATNANGKVSKWVLAAYEDSSDEEDEEEKNNKVVATDGAW